QRDLAAAIGVSASYISKWERGERVPKLEHIYSIEEVTQVPHNWIVTTAEVLTPTNACLTVDEIWGQLVLVPNDISSLDGRLHRVA
ncbi:MAG TPA: helix-turn-helix transcriptional regulator, partial [Acidimicrobiia bacterium]